jgi:hypothetical protein
MLLLHLLLFFDLHVPEVIKGVEAALELLHIQRALLSVVLISDGPLHLLLQLLKDDLLSAFRHKLVLVLVLILYLLKRRG